MLNQPGRPLHKLCRFFPQSDTKNSDQEIWLKQIIGGQLLRETQQKRPNPTANQSTILTWS